MSICFNTKYGDLVDNNNLLEDMRNVGHHGNGDYRTKINDNTHLKDIVDFINQVINL